MTVNANSIVQHAIQIKNEIMINANASIKSIACAQKIIVGILAHVFARMVRILKSIPDTSVIVYDKIINATDTVSTNMTNTIPTNMSNALKKY